ncbi:MAG: hypothetical protein ABR555_16265 [Pyrinomonadaceae bacterium]
MSKLAWRENLRDTSSSFDLFHTVYQQLFTWCEKHDFAGHDPFDALNSRVFNSTPLARSRTARLVFTQMLRRSPADPRRLALIPPGRNAKAMALFALASVADHRRVQTTETESKARRMLGELADSQLTGYSGPAWGYNFDWQGRSFFARKDTPTVVPTAFAARAFFEASVALNSAEYLTIARHVCDFIIHDLRRTVDNENEICFSYTTHSNDQIYNSTLLAGEILASVGMRTGETELCDLAQRAARFVINHQLENGAWRYGAAENQQWIDNFHTAFVLFSLSRIIRACSLNDEFQRALDRGYQYWKNTFFLVDGWPKYYDENPYPADAHAAASAVVTFLELRSCDPDGLNTGQKVASWAIQNLRDRGGFFYYQRRRFYTVRKPYMRWSQAWMLYALARLLEMLDDRE